MKKLLYIILICSVLLFGSTRGDVKIIEASENIQYLSQKIAVDYLLLYTKEDDKFLKKRIEKNIKRLELYVDEISETTKSESTKRYLGYLRISLKSIKKILNQKKSMANVELILAHGEEFIEGADAIIEEHKYNYTKDEKMLMLSKKAQYLFEYITSYYLASKIGLSSNFNRYKMYQAIDKIDKILTKVNDYNYSKEIKKDVEEICTIWTTNKEFFGSKNRVYIPHILLHSTQYSQDILEKIELYHKKNL